MGFQQLQQQFAAHIRHPGSPSVAGMEERRLKIYRELFYNNVEGFIAGGFPVLRSIMADADWHGMVRDFLRHHQCHTPYFLEIGQEFMRYLNETRSPRPDDPPFMVELAHYEWLELALDIAEETIDETGLDADGDLMTSPVVVSPTCLSLTYRFPVHRIGPGFQPDQAPEQPTYLVVYRNREDEVGFMEINTATARLLALLNGDEPVTGAAALTRLAAEMQHPQPEQLLAFGQNLMADLRQRDILLGTLSAQ